MLRVAAKTSVSYRNWQDLCDNSLQRGGSKSMGSSSSRSASKSLDLSTHNELQDDVTSEPLSSRKAKKRKWSSDVLEWSDGDSEDVDDPLLITKVKLRPNKVKKLEPVQRIRAIKTKKKHNIDKEDKESIVVNPEAKPRRYVIDFYL